MEDFKKYFDNKEYVTKIVGAEEETEGLSVANDKITSLIQLLTLSENKDFKEETLMILKKEKAGDLLITAIKKTKRNKHILVAACWESEIDFSNHLPYFIDLALDSDYLVSLEAITVISTMEGPFMADDVKNAISKVKEEQKKLNSERVVLLNDLALTLEGFM
ncbi:MAG: hypothetical protein WCP52_05450 [Bacteroidota bacterium]